MPEVITFNIRYTDDPDGNSIAERAPRLKKVIDGRDPDLIGFQECTPAWMEFIEKYWGEDYEIINQYRAHHSLESTPILYKRDKFECLKKGWFWLSDTPEEESGGWDECGCYRICCYTVLKCKSCGKTFTFMNTHFGFGDDNQVKSAKLIRAKSEEISAAPAFCTGDFNMTPEKIGYKTMTEFFTDVNAVTEKDFNTTYHGYDKDYTGEHIDYCFIDKRIKPVSSKVIYDLVDGKFPSDHYGIEFKLEI